MAFWVRLFIVRHGHVDYFDENKQPINPKFAPLSRQGKQQIQALSEVLKNIVVDRAYSSTLPRSIETLELLLDAHVDVKREHVDALREIKAGRLKEVNYEQADLIIRNAYKTHSLNLDDFIQGEKWNDFKQRVIHFIEDILVNAVEENILISSHDAVNRVFINWVYGNLQADIYAQEQHYGCLNIIDVQMEAGKIINKRIQLQNYTPTNVLKQTLFNNAMDDVYQTFIAANGYKG